MEPVEGVTLKERLGSGSLPFPEALDYVVQALSALSDAHARGVIHRNINPANMVVTAGGAVKLVDFGVAGSGAAAGEPRYASPEQIEGREPDARSDLYSVGVVLEDLVAGAQPLPAELSEIIQLATAREPEKRFQSAAAFRAAIESVRGVAPAVAPSVPAAAAVPSPPAATAQVPRTRSGHRTLYVTLGAALVLAVLVIGAMYVPGWLKTRTGESPATVQQEVPATVQPNVPGTPSEQPPPVQQPSTAPQSSEQPPAASRQAAGAGPSRQTQPAAREPARISAPPSQKAESSQPAQVPPADLAKVAALKELQKGWPMLASRAGTVTARLQDLQEEQRRAGYGLRGDIAASWKRLEHYMDQAEDALSAKNPDAARTNMENAERELGTLEKFLGR